MEDVELTQQEEEVLNQKAEAFAEYIKEMIRNYSQEQTADYWQALYLNFRILQIIKGND